MSLSFVKCRRSFVYTPASVMFGQVHVLGHVSYFFFRVEALMTTVSTALAGLLHWVLPLAPSFFSL